MEPFSNRGARQGPRTTAGIFHLAAMGEKETGAVRPHPFVDAGRFRGSSPP